jgi:hypothetical protein
MYMATIAIEAPPPFFGASLSVIFVSIFRIAENRVRIHSLGVPCAPQTFDMLRNNGSCANRM